MTRSTLLFLSINMLTSLLHAAPGPGTTNDFGGRRVLIIGIDGLRPDTLQEVMKSGAAPQLQRLVNEGTVTWNAFAGGPLGTPQQQPTMSGPGWASICTGTWIDLHGIKGNQARLAYRVTQAPHFAKRLHEKAPQAQVDLIASWGWLNDSFAAAQPEQFALHSKGAGKEHADRDIDVKSQAVQRLATSHPDVLQLHFDQIDHAGHAHGFGSSAEYRDAITKVDALIGEVLAAMQSRSQFAQEQWSVIVTTDHGGKGKNHGGQSAEERSIFFIAKGPSFASGKVSAAAIGHTAVPPTAFAALGVDIDPAWHWAEKPLE